MISLNERMRTYYEDCYRMYLTRRMPAIIRVDGRCFHTLTRGCKRPFDEELACCINQAALALCREIQGAKIAYIQSDEINILLHDYDRFSTDAWLRYNIQKMVSIAAGIASAVFSSHFGKIGIFDARVFNIPREDAANYLISRQQDWERNSLSMFARTFFSQNELHDKGTREIHEMLHNIGQNWASLDAYWKNGRYCWKSEVVGWKVLAAPIFKERRDIVENLLMPIES